MSNDIVNRDTFTVMADLRKAAEQLIAPMADSFDVVHVAMSVTDGVLQDYLRALYNEIQTSASLTGGVVPFTEDDFIAYGRTMVKARIDWVNGSNPQFHPADRIAIPSYLTVVLENIGRATNIDLGLELVPVYQDDGRTLTKEEVQRISNQLKVLGQRGLEYSDGFARDKAGSYDFMTMSVVNNMLKAPSKDAHPVYALLAASVGSRMVEDTLSPRVTYGSMDHLRSLVRNLARLKV